MPSTDTPTNPGSATDTASYFRVGAIAALIGVIMIPVQIVIFVLAPPPVAVTDWFALFEQNWFLGLLNLDLLYLVTNVLLIFIYLALFISLRKTNEPVMVMALMLGLVGIAVYFSCNTGFEMMTLSHRFTAAVSEAERSSLLAAGEAMLATYTGTTFTVYYILNAITLLLMSWVMLKSDVFSKTTGWFGLASGILMSIPSTFGMIGLIFAFLSLAPWAVFSVLLVRRFFQLSRSES